MGLQQKEAAGATWNPAASAGDSSLSSALHFLNEIPPPHPRRAGREDFGKPEGEGVNVLERTPPPPSTLECPRSEAEEESRGSGRKKFASFTRTFCFADGWDDNATGHSCGPGMGAKQHWEGDHCWRHQQPHKRVKEVIQKTKTKKELR